MSDPEKALTYWLQSLSKHNYKRMYRYCQITWKKNNHRSKLKMFDGIHIKNHQIGEIEVLGYGARAIMVDYDMSGTRYRSRVMVVAETKPFLPDEKKGRWGVNPVSFLRKKELTNES